MPSSAKVLAELAFAFLPSLVAAQSTLGDLLDAGAKRLTAEDFKREIVQHSIAGPTALGGIQEVMYAANGTVQGIGSNPLEPPDSYRSSIPMSGEWKVGEGGTICTAMRITPTTGAVTTLPPRCQVWFKLGEAYFVSDSDTDRRVAVLRRSIKASSAVAVAPSDLGQLLDAGAKKLSAAEFKRDVAQRPLVTTLSNGAGAEIIYATDGSIQGTAQPSPNYPWNMTVSGEWGVADGERVCTSMRFAGGTNLVRDVPRQCQSWFKLRDDYYVADSDSNRLAAISRRSIKQTTVGAAPSNLGELLDAGAARLSVEEFKREVVHRTVLGRGATGHRFEIMYAANGSIVGMGTSINDPPNAFKADNPITGEWRVGDAGRICTSIRLVPNTGAVQVLPTDCQVWFKLGDAFFASSSESDRRAKVLGRTIKP